MSMLLPVILSGGSGTRLWPLSRQSYPKQLINLVGEYTLLQQTALRAVAIDELASPLIVCSEDYRFVVAEQLRQIGIDSPDIILEPMGRNTAAAVALSALFAVDQDSSALLFCMPADHLISDASQLSDLIHAAKPLAESSCLLTFGVKPDKPHTGYGYIQVGESRSDGVFSVRRFVEKPSLKTATAFLAAGDYYWNSGIFLMAATDYLQQLQRYAPDIYKACLAAYQKRHSDGGFVWIDASEFGRCPSQSIDYAVIEHAENLAMIPFNADWKDIGSWRALWHAHSQDNDGNVIVGDVLTESVSNSYIRSQNRLIAVVGVDNHVIVDTDDAVLIAHKDRCQDLNKLVKQLHRSARSEAKQHRKLVFSWGERQTLSLDEKCCVNKIVINPQQRYVINEQQVISSHCLVLSGRAMLIKPGDVKNSLGVMEAVVFFFG